MFIVSINIVLKCAFKQTPFNNTCLHPRHGLFFNLVMFFSFVFFCFFKINTNFSYHPRTQLEAGVGGELAWSRLPGF